MKTTYIITKIMEDSARLYKTTLELNEFELKELKFALQTSEHSYNPELVKKLERLIHRGN